jgi:hypothetical protein
MKSHLNTITTAKGFSYAHRTPITWPLEAWLKFYRIKEKGVIKRDRPGSLLAHYNQTLIGDHINEIFR